MKEMIEVIMEHGWVGTMVAVLVGFNLVLSGLSKILDLVKDKTATKIDNKIADYILKMITGIQKALDWLGANREHK